MKPAISLVCLLLNYQAFALAEDGCSEVLNYAARNESLTIFEDHLARSVSNRFCSGSKVKDGTQFTAGLKAVIEEVPVSFNLGHGSTQERTEHFCKTFDEALRADIYRFSRTSTVVTSSVDAWLRCKQLSTDIQFKPTIKPQRVIVDVSKTGANPVSIIGVDFSTEELTCEAEVGGATKPVNKNTSKILNDAKVWTITCPRVGEKRSDGVYYPHALLTIRTSAGSFVLDIDRDAKLNEAWTDVIEAKIAALKADLKDTTRRLNETRLEETRADVRKLPNWFETHYDVIDKNDNSGPAFTYMIDYRSGTQGLANPNETQKTAFAVRTLKLVIPPPAGEKK